MTIKISVFPIYTDKHNNIPWFLIYDMFRSYKAIIIRKEYTTVKEEKW
jgi:hypothetical protein